MSKESTVDGSLSWLTLAERRAMSMSPLAHDLYSEIVCRCWVCVGTSVWVSAWPEVSEDPSMVAVMVPLSEVNQALIKLLFNGLATTVVIYRVTYIIMGYGLGGKVIDTGVGGGVTIYL